jgi:hypothetical protein
LTSTKKECQVSLLLSTFYILTSLKVQKEVVEFDKKSSSKKQRIPITTRNGVLIGQVGIPPGTFQPGTPSYFISVNLTSKNTGCKLIINQGKPDANTASKDGCEVSVDNSKVGPIPNLTLTNCPHTDLSHLKKFITIILLSLTKS